MSGNTGNMNISLDHNRHETRGLKLQILTAHPTDNVPESFVYYNSTEKTAYIFADPNWLDLGYLHETFESGNIFTQALELGQVIDQIVIDNGHIVEVTFRDMTPDDIGAAEKEHEHTVDEIVEVNSGVVLGRKSTGVGSVEELTQQDLLEIIGIGIGDALTLSAGTDQTPMAWSALDITEYIADYVSTALQDYLTEVNLSATHEPTKVVIGNSAGDGAEIGLVNSTNAGLMSPTQNDKLDGIEDNANFYEHPEFSVVNDFVTAVIDGLKVLSYIEVTDEGHVVTVGSRTITASDIAAVIIADTLQNSGTTWSSDKVVSYVTNAIEQAQAGAMKFVDGYNPNTNVPDILSSTEIKTGYTYVISASGTFLGEDVEVGDMLIAKTNNPGSVLNNWMVVNKNIPAIVEATELVSGLIKIASVSDALAGMDSYKAITPRTLKLVLDANLGSYRADFGDGFTTMFVFQHDLGTQDIDLVLLQTSNKERVYARWLATSNNTATVHLVSPPGVNGYRALIHKI